MLGSKPISVLSDPIISRVKCIDCIGKGVLHVNSHLGSNPDPSYIQNHVIMNCVIKRFRCIQKWFGMMHRLFVQASHDYWNSFFFLSLYSIISFWVMGSKFVPR